MVKLSQRAWNNVLIVCMLFLIFMFNFSSNLLNDEVEPQAISGLIPRDRVVTTIVFEQHKVERIGQGWRVLPSLADTTALNRLIESWMQAQIKRLDHAPSLGVDTQATSVTLWFVGVAEPKVYEFFPQGEQTWLKIDQHYFQLMTPSFNTLIISE